MNKYDILRKDFKLILENSELTDAYCFPGELLLKTVAYFLVTFKKFNTLDKNGLFSSTIKQCFVLLFTTVSKHHKGCSSKHPAQVTLQMFTGFLDK